MSTELIGWLVSRRCMIHQLSLILIKLDVTDLRARSYRAGLNICISYTDVVTGVQSTEHSRQAVVVIVAMVTANWALFCLVCLFTILWENVYSLWNLQKRLAVVLGWWWEWHASNAAAVGGVVWQKDAVPEDYFCRDPDHRTIYRFIRNLFHSAQLTAECAIVTLVSRSLSSTLQLALSHVICIAHLGTNLRFA